MSTAELKQIIDQRTPEERKWMTAYLLDEMFSVPELHQTAQELTELAQRRGDLLAGPARVAEDAAQSHWNSLDKQS
jgi:pyruvate-formate lyase